MSRLSSALAVDARRAALVLAAAASAALGCGHAAPRGATRDVRLTSASRSAAEDGARPVSQAELQEDLQRFTGQFLDRVAQAVSEVAGPGAPSPVSDQALRMSLLYSASALDIATGPLPEVGVLDMAVFMRLGRLALEEYWIPAVYGERGQPFVVAFARSEEQLWDIVAKITTAEQREELVARIDAWRTENPGQIRVEGVRLTDFSKRAGAVEAERAEEIGGLLAQVKSTTQAADQALLMAERGMFLANRIPFLLRQQMRVGSREILGDALNMVGSTEAIVTRAKELEPIVEQLPPLVATSADAAHEARLLVEEVEPLVPTREAADRIERTLESANSLTERTSTLLGELRAAASEDSPLRRLAGRFDAALARGLGFLVLLGAAWSAMWWGGYVLAKRAVNRRAASAPS